jgi:multicomponent Na+:H+ antiporter subunit A
MVAGLIDHEAGTRDITGSRGLRKAMPITFVAAMLAALSMGGLPLFFGFLARKRSTWRLARPRVGKPYCWWSPSAATH